jgi:ankyrin repeat protein
MEKARFLLEHGANANLPDYDGMTPLLQVAQDGYREGAELLLEHGAKVDYRHDFSSLGEQFAGKLGPSVWDVATPEIKELLRQRGHSEPPTQE